MFLRIQGHRTAGLGEQSLDQALWYLRGLRNLEELDMEGEESGARLGKSGRH
jgi:hypothetical protein